MYSYTGTDGATTQGLDKQEAFRRVYENKGLGRVTAPDGSTIWDRGVVIEPQAPSFSVAPVPRADSNETVTMLGESGTVSDVAAQRIAEDEAFLFETVGIKLPPPVYAPGSRINETGTGNLRTSRLEYEAMPDTVDGLRDIARSIAAEERKDYTVKASDLRMLNNGTLITPSGEFATEDEGLRHLARTLLVSGQREARIASILGRDEESTLFPRGHGLLSAMPPDLRAQVFNRMVKDQSRPEQRVTLRTRTYGDKPSLFAVVGERYAAFDADKVAMLLASSLDGLGARGAVTYDSRTTTLKADATFHADQVVDFAAGDVFKVGASFRSNDAAGGSIRGDASAWRNRCLNLIIIGVGSAPLFAVQHRGDTDRVRADVSEGLTQADAVFQHFAARWGKLRQTAITSVTLWGETFSTVPDALTWAVDNGKIDRVMARDAMVQSLIQAHGQEPGDSLADILNAITRAAHESLIADIKRDVMERAAGALIPSLVRAAEA